MKSIAFYNNKGGVGKTTSAINVSYELAKNSKVLIMLNATQRTYTSADTMREYEELERIFKALEEAGKPVKAKGLLSVILSLPPDWDYTVTGLAVIAADGVDSVKTAVKELEKYGYIVRKQLRDELGRMARNEYRVYESPADNPDFVSDEEDTIACISGRQNEQHTLLDKTAADIV